MNDELDLSDLSLIDQFLGNFAPSVSARSAPISPELRKKIVQFARGELSGDARATTAAEILQNNSAVELLAEEIRAAA